MVLRTMLCTFPLKRRGLDANFILKDIYGIDISPSTISRLTDKIMPGIRNWLSRPLESVYPFVFIEEFGGYIHTAYRGDGKTKV